MNNPRKYGRAPFCVAVIHGGPGAAGEMAPVARALSSTRGTLEPLQNATSIQGQIEELKDQLEGHSSPPVCLIGFSWGAWLSWMTAAKFPRLVSKLILLSSPPFQEKYAVGIQKTRLERLGAEEKAEVETLAKVLTDPSAMEKNVVMARLGSLFSKADAYNPVEGEPEAADIRFEVFQSIWEEAVELRKNGGLLEFGRHIQCPVTAIHGDYDPHPAEGVRLPLAAVLKKFNFILLKNCGHRLWLEREAKTGFFLALNEEISVKNH